MKPFFINFAFIITFIMTKIMLDRERSLRFPRRVFMIGKKCGELVEGKRRVGGWGRARVGARKFFFHDLDVVW